MKPYIEPVRGSVCEKELVPGTVLVQEINAVGCTWNESGKHGEVQQRDTRSHFACAQGKSRLRHRGSKGKGEVQHGGKEAG